jgi:Alanine racemase, N-terminal domain
MITARPAKVWDLPTPALLVDADALEDNIAVMAAVLPGERLRPHVKAHKCTGIARRQAAAGHRAFTCATIRECEGMAAAGLGEDLLLANEVLDATRLGDLVRAGSRVTLAVDSPQTIAAAAAGGVPEVVIDVNVGLPRCGCAPGDAGALADRARAAGLAVRGVMGYEGHVVGVEDESARARQCETAMALLLAAHADVGGDLVSAGGTGTYACNTWATEIQAGSYALMDTAYGRLGLPFIGPCSCWPRWCRRVRSTRSPTPGSRPSPWTTGIRRSKGPPCGSARTSTRPSRRPGGSGTRSGSSRRTSTRRWPTTTGSMSSRATMSSTSGPSTCAGGPRPTDQGAGRTP